MAEEGVGQITDRIEREGQLTRNSGTNSIKSIVGRLDNFAPVFNAISGSLQTQTALLEDAFLLQAKAIESTEEAEKDEGRKTKLTPDGPDPKPKPKPESKNDRKAFKDIIKDNFTANKIGLAIVAAAAAPFLAGILDGAINEVTNGGFDKFKEFVVNDLPDVFKNLKESIALIYGNFDAFMQTGSIEDLLMGADGQPIIDVEGLKERATEFATVAINLLVLGPLGAIGAAVGFALTNTIEDLTGYDIPESIEAGLATLIGLQAAGVNVVGKKGLIARAFNALVMTPYGRVAMAVGLSIAGVVALLKNAREVNEAKMNEVSKELNEAAEIAATGDIVAANAKIDEAMNNLSLIGPVGQTREIIGVTDESQRNVDQAIGNAGLATFNEMLKAGFDPNASTENINTAMQYIADGAAKFGTLNEEDTEKLFRTLFNIMPTKVKGSILDSLDIGVDSSDAAFQVAAAGLLQRSGLSNPEAEGFGRLLAPVLKDIIIKQADEAVKQFNEAFSSTLDTNPLESFMTDPTSSKKTTFLDNLSNDSQAGSMFAPMSINSGGNVVKGGDQINNTSQMYIFRNGSDASGTLYNTPHSK